MSNKKLERELDEMYGVGKCPDCGKIRFRTRKAAKSRARQRCPGEQISVYRCGDFFHWGHTPYGIKRGFRERPR